MRQFSGQKQIILVFDRSKDNNTQSFSNKVGVGINSHC